MELRFCKCSYTLYPLAKYPFQKERGGHPISVTMDHGEDAEVEQLFARIRAEQRGRLDILVNNAYAGVATIFSSVGETRYSR